LTPAFIAELILEMNAEARKDKADLKLYHPDAFVSNDYKNWIKKVTNYLDLRMGKAGVPLLYMICAPNVDPESAPDAYTRAFCWAALFQKHQLRRQKGSMSLV
jgi:hypothetical protein